MNCENMTTSSKSDEESIPRYLTDDEWIAQRVARAHTLGSRQTVQAMSYIAPAAIESIISGLE